MRVRFAGAASTIGLLLVFFCFNGAASQLITWGQTNLYGLATIPGDLTNAVGVAIGDSHSAVLRANGTVSAWGNNIAGQTNVPSNLSNVVAIAAAAQHTLALRSNGTVVAWGTGGTNIPPGLTNAIAIAAGDNHGLALTANGMVIAWGDYSFSPTNVPAGLSNVVAVAAGANFSAALQAEGSVVTWGSSGGPSTIGMTNIAMIAANEFPLIVLKANGTTIVAGGLTPPASVTNVVSVASDRYGTLALKGDGTVIAWGGAPDPTPPATLTNVEVFASGQYHCLGIVGSGRPVVVTRAVPRNVAPGARFPLLAAALGDWPLSFQWQLNGTNLPGATNQILALTNVLPQSGGNYSVIVTNTAGSVTGLVSTVTVQDFGVALDTTNLDWTTGGDAAWLVESTVTHDGASALQSGPITNNQSSIVQTTVTGPGTLTFWWKVSSSSAALRFEIGNSVQASLSGNVDWQQRTFYLGDGPQVLKWILSKSGSGAAGAGWLDGVAFVPGATAPFFSLLPVSQSQAPGFSVTLSGAAQGTPPISYRWQLSGTDVPGASNASLTLTNLQRLDVGIYTLVVSNSAGVTNINAAVELGQIATWGDNGYGQITVPPGMTNLLAIAGNKIHNLALRTDGTVVAWGDNGSGRSTVPIGLSNVIAVAGSAGAEYSLALKSDGTVAAWGDNTFGQTNVPSDLSNVVAVAAGWYHGMALTAEGKVRAWGYNNDGETDIPAGLSNVVTMAGGSFHSLAVTADGNVVGWGQNSAQTVVPAGLSNVVGVAGGLFFSSAVRSDGTMSSWGDNSSGQTNVPADLTNALGTAAGWYHSIVVTWDGTVRAGDTNSTVPAGITNAIAVGAGIFHNLALEGAPPRAFAVNPEYSTNGFSVSMPSQSGKVYRLEYKNSLGNATWIPLPLVAGTGRLLTFTDPAPASSQRLYRIRRW